MSSLEIAHGQRKKSEELLLIFSFLFDTAPIGSDFQIPG